jgi:hypothetical protein
MATVRDRMFGS